MRGRPQGSSASLTSADVRYFQPSIPGYGERRKNGTSHPISLPVPCRDAAHHPLESCLEIWASCSRFRHKRGLFGNNKTRVKLFGPPGQVEAFLFVKGAFPSRGCQCQPRCLA